MKKSKWPPDKTAQLRALAEEGLCRREICVRMQLGINAVTTKLVLLGLHVPLNPPETIRPRGKRAVAPHAKHLARFPRYEDITPAEAAAAARGAPPSAPYRIVSYAFTLYSPGGNSGEMCAP